MPTPTNVTLSPLSSPGNLSGPEPITSFSGLARDFGTTTASQSRVTGRSPSRGRTSQSLFTSQISSRPAVGRPVRRPGPLSRPGSSHLRRSAGSRSRSRTAPAERSSSPESASITSAETESDDEQIDDPNVHIYQPLNTFAPAETLLPIGSADVGMAGVADLPVASQIPVKRFSSTTNLLDSVNLAGPAPPDLNDGSNFFTFPPSRQRSQPLSARQHHIQSGSFSSKYQERLGRATRRSDGSIRMSNSHDPSHRNSQTHSDLFATSTRSARRRPRDDEMAGRPRSSSHQAGLVSIEQSVVDALTQMTGVPLYGAPKRTSGIQSAFVVGQASFGLHNPADVHSFVSRRHTRQPGSGSARSPPIREIVEDGESGPVNSRQTGPQSDAEADAQPLDMQQSPPERVVDHTPNVDISVGQPIDQLINPTAPMATSHTYRPLSGSTPEPIANSQAADPDVDVRGRTGEFGPHDLTGHLPRGRLGQPGQRDPPVQRSYSCLPPAGRRQLSRHRPTSRAKSEDAPKLLTRARREANYDFRTVDPDQSMPAGADGGGRFVLSDLSARPEPALESVDNLPAIPPSCSPRLYVRVVEWMKGIDPQEKPPMPPPLPPVGDDGDYYQPPSPSDGPMMMNNQIEVLTDDEDDDEFPKASTQQCPNRPQRPANLGNMPPSSQPIPHFEGEQTPIDDEVQDGNPAGDDVINYLVSPVLAHHGFHPHHPDHPNHQPSARNNSYIQDAVATSPLVVERHSSRYTSKPYGQNFEPHPFAIPPADYDFQTAPQERPHRRSRRDRADTGSRMTDSHPASTNAANASGSDPYSPRQNRPRDPTPAYRPDYNATDSRYPPGYTSQASFHGMYYNPYRPDWSQPIPYSIPYPPLSSGMFNTYGPDMRPPMYFVPASYSYFPGSAGPSQSTNQSVGMDSSMPGLSVGASSAPASSLLDRVDGFKPNVSVQTNGSKGGKKSGSKKQKRESIKKEVQGITNSGDSFKELLEHLLIKIPLGELGKMLSEELHGQFGEEPT